MKHLKTFESFISEGSSAHKLGTDLDLKDLKAGYPVAVEKQGGIAEMGFIQTIQRDKLDIKTKSGSNIYKYGDKNISLPTYGTEFTTDDGKKVLIESITEAKMSLSDFYEKNIDKHNSEKTFMKAATKMGFKESDVKALLDDIEQGGNTYSKLSDNIFNESLNEGADIEKISKEFSKVALEMKDTVDAWKKADGDEKVKLLMTLKELTAKKKTIGIELNNAISSKDKNIELVITE